VTSPARPPSTGRRISALRTRWLTVVLLVASAALAITFVYTSSRIANAASILLLIAAFSDFVVNYRGKR
jgi:hypothetical protein